MHLITVSILTALLLIRFLLMPQMGSYLVLEHELRDAGAIVLLLGSTPERELEVADLYRQGLAPQVIITEYINRGMGFGLFEGNTLYLTMINTNTM